ncbi:MAG TPA: peptidyl-prolyl cis-trans isomerase [Blastocatellia bacterium]|nr:peptidyl-prolyl cis-trans isomerase [Blastocatellia bacterium]HMV84908.1 peptidyl-prolyl cis-trans isomerase [Blastocatellia bacterium]HMX26157.1 peptidyl-prolyl cis-trans isomerase [Blastocatellia bacterium]HMY73274.1 peptidyl-prolyl cis-trans isomerase [Blastocatellia bacterium]HMZ19838.1 peptidyl-prolyl cis-trans isomerase [Blastocatellia bacterium]
MLRFFTKLERSRNLVLLAFCAILLIGLIAFYIPTSRSGAGRPVNDDDQIVIAKVGSQEIKLGQYRAQIAQIGSMIGRGNTLPMQTLKAFGADKQALEQLITTFLTLDQADRLGLVGSNGEIGDIIRRQFTDANGAFVGREEYIRRLRLQGVDVAQYEQDRRNEISTRKVRAYLTSAEQVSDRDVEEKFKKDNTKVELVYAAVDLDKIRSKYKPTEEELKAYYDGHKDDFKATQPTRKVDYIFVATKDVEKIISVPDAELKAQYETNKQYEKRASIIRLDVLASADEESVNAKAQDLLKRAKGTPGGAPAEDFAVLAKGNSQDTATKDKGGDLGFIKKDANKTSDWKQRVYTNDLKVGDIDGPFREGPSWYILKITEQREIPFEQMKPTLLATAKNNKAFSKANELAQKVYEKATELNPKDLKKGAEEVSKELKVSVDSMSKTTPYFKDGDSLPGLGDSTSRASNPAFDSAVSSLKKGEIGTPVSIPGGYAVPQVIDIVEGGAALTFDQARNQVEDKLRQEKEPNLAKARAQELVNQAGSAADLERLIKAEGLDVKKDTNFNNYQFPGAASGGLQAQNLARAMMFNLKEGEVNKTPVKVGASYLIFAAAKRTEADLSKLAAERESVRQNIIIERQNTAYEAFVKELRKRYEAEGKIKIYQDRIDNFFAKADAQQR